MPKRIYQRLRYIARAGLRRRLRDVILMRGPQIYSVRREDLARLFIRGDGVEIGPLTWPMRLPPGTTVRYVDYASREDLLAEYGDNFSAQTAHASAVPETDVIDDATHMATFADESLDFVVANHVLEHLEDPVLALTNLLRVLRPGGILFLALPDARETFDDPRERTTLEHVLRDHAEGPEVSRRQHYEEWARHIEGHTGAELTRRVDEYAAEDARHHFHVWELDTFLAMLRGLDLPCRLELGQTNGHEFVVILRRVAAA